MLINQAGQAASGNVDRTTLPPDTTGAIGASQYIETVNAQIALSERVTNSIGKPTVAPLQSFVGARATDNVFDPQIEWDPIAGRFFYLMDRVKNGGTPKERDYLAFGWSRTAHPTDFSGYNPTKKTGSWCKFFYGGTKNAGFAGTFKTARVSVVTKPSATDASACSKPARRIFGTAKHPLQNEGGASIFQPDPVAVMTTSALGFVVAADSPTPTGNQITAYLVPPGPLGKLALVRREIPVPAYGLPPSARQPRTRLRIGTAIGGATPLTQSVGVPGALLGQIAVWTQHTVRASDGRSDVRWYQLAPALGLGQIPPIPLASLVLQQGDVQDKGTFAFNGAIAPTLDGASAALNFNASSPKLLVRVRAQSRGAKTPPGRMTGEVTLARSASADRDYSCFGAGSGGLPVGVCRWGDYAGASTDPTATTQVWGSNQDLGIPPSLKVCQVTVGKKARPCPSWQTRNFALGPVS